jgi:hypothetical protein
MRRVNGSQLDQISVGAHDWVSICIKCHMGWLDGVNVSLTDTDII